MSLDANALFEEELTRRGATFVRVDDDRYELERDGWKISANLANIRRDAERDDDPDRIRVFVDRVLSIAEASTPPWSEASGQLLFSAERIDQDLGTTVFTRVTDDVARVLTLSDPDQTHLSLVTSEMCAEWGVTPEDAMATALVNQDGLLGGISVQAEEIDGHALGMVPLSSPYKASVIFAPAFRNFVEAAFGWPVLVVIPCRDFIYVLADKSPLLGRIGGVVVEEFRKSGYPLTVEVLRVSDDGIEAIGTYPVD